MSKEDQKDAFPRKATFSTYGDDYIAEPFFLITNVSCIARGQNLCAADTMFLLDTCFTFNMVIQVVNRHSRSIKVQLNDCTETYWLFGRGKNIGWQTWRLRKNVSQGQISRTVASGRIVDQDAANKKAVNDANKRDWEKAQKKDRMV